MNAQNQENNNGSIKGKLEPRKYVLEKFQTYLTIEKNIVNEISRHRVELQKDYRETIRNLGIVSAAIAAFALPLLNNPKTNGFILILSISFFMLNIIVSFWHLLRMHTYGSKKLTDIENVSLPPVRKVKEAALSYRRNQKSFNDFRKEEENFRKPDGEYDKIKQSLDSLSKDTKKLNYIEDLLVGILTLAILLFIYSIAAFHINPILGHYLIKLFY